MGTTRKARKAQEPCSSPLTGVDARLLDGEEAIHSSARKSKPARYKVAHNAMKRGAGSKRLVLSLNSCCFLGKTTRWE